MAKIIISGFADEIDPDFHKQLDTVKELGMKYICIRSADKKGIASYTLEDFEESILPVLEEYGISISSIGSPIGKVKITDIEGFEKQKVQLEEMCKICNRIGTKYVRMFSFFMPEGEDPAKYRDQVMAQLQEFVDIAKKYDVILLHENEKEIYGDIGTRCVDIFEAINDPHLMAAYDFANYVQCGEDTVACWNMTRPWTRYIHVKDALYANQEVVLAGTGEGKLKEILNQAINEEGYEGFLTLEPHLRIFSSLKNLETKDVKSIIKVDKYETGAEAYTASYNALCGILNEIGVKDFE